jgi:hypothetical protein
MDATLVLNQTWLGQQVRNVLVFSNVVVDESELRGFAESIRGLFSTLVAGHMSASWSLDSVTFVFNETLPIYSIEVPFTSGILIGTSAGSELATQVSLLVSTKYLGAPPNKGRIYFAGLTEFALQDGLFPQSVVDDFADLVRGLVDGITGDAQVAFLRIARRAANGTLDTTSPVTHVIGRNIPAVIRRRRLGQGS